MHTNTQTQKQGLICLTRSTLKRIAVVVYIRIVGFRKKLPRPASLKLKLVEWFPGILDDALSISRRVPPKDRCAPQKLDFRKRTMTAIRISTNQVLYGRQT